ncbi:DUF4389 domain-containing protein [Desulfococcus sp.]|uniref:DUF4389 domain-containing protein n=1 Tax=Desulfococcus sp. TaxID=2025834 RepID=UPI003593CFAD
MDQIKKMLFTLLSSALKFILTRKKIAIYICLTALYCILCGMIGFALLILTALQWFFLLILTRPNPAIKGLCHRLTVYIYRMLRYIVLCESEKPYPFGPMPQEIEPAGEPDLKADAPEKNFFDRAAEKSSHPASDAGRSDPSGINGE